MFENSLRGRFMFLTVSIILNAVSNALTVSTNMGSAIWTASATNLSHWLGISLGTILFLEGVIVAIANLAFLGRFDYFRLIRNLLYTLPFSYLLSGFVVVFNRLGVPALPIYVRAVLDIIGIFGIAVAVSLYQRANLIMHPNDDLPYILRYRFFHGSAVLAQYISYVPPIIITVLSALMTGHLYAVNFGTVWMLATQGWFIAWADRNVCGGLHHHLEFKN